MRHYWLVYPLFLVLLASSAFGAVVHGGVYDLELNTLSKAVVEIDTAPKQVMVSHNGTYQFTIAPGTYTIVARHSKLDLVAEERIRVQGEGSYVLDLILFPDLEEEEDLLNETIIIDEYEEPIPFPWRVAVFAAVIVLALLAWLYWKSRRPSGEAPKKTPKADLEEILAFVRKEGGRTTQKDLRRAIPYSEAKISLMIAELESQGRLKKIKKGRGNIIVLP